MSNPTLLLTLLFLAFFRLLTGLIESTYAFGLLQTDIPPEIGFVLLLLSPLALVLSPRWLSGRAARSLALSAGLLVLLGWGLLPWLDTRSKLLAGGIGAGLFWLFLPALLRAAPGLVTHFRMGSALALAGLASTFLHALNAGLPPAGLQARLVYGLLAGLGVVLLRGLPARAMEPAPSTPPRRAGFLPVTGAWLGLLSALLLLYFGFTTPAVIARWAGVHPTWVTLTAAAAPALLLGVWSRVPDLPERLPRWAWQAWNALFVLALAVVLLPNQVAFPPAPGGYPLAEQPAGPLVPIALGGLLLLHPVIYLDFACLASWLARSRASTRALGGGLSLAALYFLLAIFAHVFTTVYDYIPVAGPWFRDRFWLVTTIPALVMAIAGGLARRANPAPAARPKPTWSTGAQAESLLILTALALALTTPRPASPPFPDGLRVLTFNIQQGYDTAGQVGIPAQLALVRAQAPDLLGLQESDMARVANGNADLVGHFASRLGMHAYAGPSIVTGTFGIALLSRYPIDNPRTFYMYSQGEQTAAIVAEIQAGVTRFTVIVTHLGNGGPLIQQQQVLALAEGRQNVIMMGDFNFRPDSQQYHLTTTGLVDAWLMAGEQVSELTENDLTRRIDHVFLSPGQPVLRSVYLARGPSDHPALFVQLGLPGE